MSRGKCYNKIMKNTHVTDIFKVLQDPIRIRIIEMLRFDQERREFFPDSSEAEGGFCPMDILTILQEEGVHISNTKLSYHLKEMKNTHVIYLVKEGKRNFYLFNKDSLEVIQAWINFILKG